MWSLFHQCSGWDEARIWFYCLTRILLKVNAHVVRVSMSQLTSDVKMQDTSYIAGILALQLRNSDPLRTVLNDMCLRISSSSYNGRKDKTV